MLMRLEVVSREGIRQSRSHLQLLQQDFGMSVTKVDQVRVLLCDVPTLTPRPLLESVLLDPILEIAHWSEWMTENPPDWVVEVAPRPGVTDNVARSAEAALRLVGIENPSVMTMTLWRIWSVCALDELQQVTTGLLANSLIQQVSIQRLADFLDQQRFTASVIPSVCLSPFVEPYQIYDCTRSLAQWQLWSRENCWALNTMEIQHLQAYFLRLSTRQRRQHYGLPEHPTDLEVEVIAQSWSEHCKHKIFAARIDYRESIADTCSVRLGDLEVDSLFQTYIRGATMAIEETRSLPWLRSVFHDNAGVVAFDEAVDLAIKVETHNSPSALDPFGGAITGILGVNRDILGVGLGAKPIANMDVFCVADPVLPRMDAGSMPEGLQSPKRLLDGIHRGVQAGGNLSGIPTVNGAMFFDRDYAGKPLVFVGTVGVMPKMLADGRSGVSKSVQCGDRIVMVGGAIGLDGIHGATFSSMALDDTAPATAVQIGDPMTQRRLTDWLMEARDLGLIRCITDNGAGGLSSSVGEMALLCNGAELELGKAPTKYPNLNPWQLMVSESQERMTLAVAPEQLTALLELARLRGVVATDVGQFTDTGYLLVYYHQRLVGHLSLAFLHDSLPQQSLMACWDGPRDREAWIPEYPRQNPNDLSLAEKLQRVLHDPNVASKEPWVRQYDHEVQAATIGKPFGGQTQQGPNDAGVIWLGPHGGADNNAVSIGCGLAPKLSLVDPYLMAQWSVDEAIRNVVATGADIDQTCVLDNFCWPDPIGSPNTPDGEYKLGQLVRCCAGLRDICVAYGVPLVSGKDSMKNDFRGRNRRGEPLTISVLPTLLVTAMGQTSLDRLQTADFKREGDHILWVGLRSQSLMASIYAGHFQIPKDEPSPTIDVQRNLSLYRKVRDLLAQKRLSSIHDVGEGGLITAVVESCMGNALSAALRLTTCDDRVLFGEATGQFVLSVHPRYLQQVMDVLDSFDVDDIGVVTKGDSFMINGEVLSMTALRTAWNRDWT